MCHETADHVLTAMQLPIGFDVICVDRSICSAFSASGARPDAMRYLAAFLPPLDSVEGAHDLPQVFRTCE